MRVAPDPPLTWTTEAALYNVFAATTLVKLVGIFFQQKIVGDSIHSSKKQLRDLFAVKILHRLKNYLNYSMTDDSLFKRVNLNEYHFTLRSYILQHKLWSRPHQC